MKQISAVMVMGLCILITGFHVRAQKAVNNELQSSAIEPYHMAITYSKTTNIIFPYAIISIDRGSKDVLVQKAKGVENILQLKAGKERFSQTNLTVITADGKLTSFIIDYTEQPSVLNLSLVNENKKIAIPIPSDNINQEEIQHYASLAAVSKVKFSAVKKETFGIRLKLNGIFIHDAIMFFRFNIDNNTNINYDIDQLRLYIRDQKKSKRTATQEIEISPVFVQNNINQIIGQTDNTIVLAVPKFTIPDNKYLAVQLMEKSGGRHPELHVRNRKMVKAVVLTEKN
jgi:conjugative transposon TraN protein